MCRGGSYRPALGRARPLLLAFAVVSLLACPHRCASGEALSGDGAGQRECWERGRGDFEEVARCLLERLRALQQRPSAAGSIGTRGLMQEVARAASALSGEGLQQSAVAILDEAIAAEPDNPNLHFLRGNALGALGQQERAAAAYAEAVARVPVHADALHNYAAVLMDLQPRSAAQSRTAVRALQTALRLVPGSARLLQSCGIVLSQLGWRRAAINFLSRSLALAPTSVPAATELSLALEASGRPDEGERALRDALAACTETGSRAELWRVLGDMLLRADSSDSKLHACDAFDESLRLDADSVHAHSGKGACLRKQGLLHLALLSYESAAKTDATPQTLTNLGSVLVEMGRFDHALDALHQALALAPDFAHASTTAGFALAELGRTSEARRYFERAVAADPQHATAWNNLGHFLRAQQQHEASVDALLRAVHLDPVPIHRFNLAESLRMVGDMEGALRHLEMVVSLANPPLFDAVALLIFYRRLICDWSAYEEDVSALTDVLAQQRLSGEQAALFAVQTLVFPLPSHLHLFSAQSLSTAAIAAATRSLGDERAGAGEEGRRGMRGAGGGWDVVGLNVEAALLPVDRRVRVGYVTADLYGHPVSDDLVAVWQAHDASRVHVLCLLTANGRIGSSPLHLSLSHPCRGRGGGGLGWGWGGVGGEGGGGEDGWRDLREVGIRESAEVMAAEKLLVIVNLHGWTAGHAMGALALVPALSFAPAPVQVNFKGFPWSTGAAFSQYSTGDRIATPPEHRAHYTEHLLLLSTTYHVNGHWHRFAAPPPPQRAADLVFEEKIQGGGFIQSKSSNGVDGAEVFFGGGGEKVLVRFPVGHHVFCSFNRQVKLDPETWEVWTQILRKVPLAVLWLLRFEPLAERNLRARARASGVDPSRLIFTQVIDEA